MNGLRAHRAGRLAATLLLTSCFTMALWGFSPEVKRDPQTHANELTYAYDEETPWSWPLFFGRVFGTPFTLALDCLTAPVQVFLFGDDGC